jgi:hypothetical protein
MRVFIRRCGRGSQMAPPKKDNIPLTLRISERLLDKIDDLRRQEKDIPTRPEMIRRLLEESLKD